MNLRSRFLIYSGGQLGDWAISDIRTGDKLIGADRGALFLINHGLRPDVAVGDFDSVDADEVALIRERSLIFFDFDPIDKSSTDTDLALQWAKGQYATEIVFYGAIGTRFDHSLANVHLLRQALDAGIPCSIVDKHNRIQLTNRELIVTQGEYSYISLLPLSEKVTGITLDGFQYPLVDATLTIGQSLGISNLLTGEYGTVRVSGGLLLVIQSRD